MLHLACLPVGLLVGDPQHIHQEPLQDMVLPPDVPCVFQTGGGEADAAVLHVVDVSGIGEDAQHLRDAGRRYVHVGRQF